MVSFAVQKLFHLMQSCLLFFAIVAFPLAVKFKESLPWLMLRSLLPVFSSRSFMGLGPFNPLELIFMNSIEWYSFFFFSARDCPAFPAHLLKRVSFAHWNILGSFIKISWLCMLKFISGLYISIPLIFVSVFMTTPCCFDKYIFVI